MCDCQILFAWIFLLIVFYHPAFVLVSLLICIPGSFTRSYIHFPRLLVELFSPHLLTRGVVEPCSAKSIVGSSRLWPSLAFFWHIVQAAAGSVLDSVPR